MTENEDLDPVGQRDPELLFMELAVLAGVIRAGDPLDRNLIDLCFALVERVAAFADEFTIEETGDTAGDPIRAAFGDMV